MTKQELILCGLKESYKLREPVFYYLAGDTRDTVCLLTDGTRLIARGIALCSQSDQFVKITGRAKALGRAIQALVNEKSMLPIRAGSSGSSGSSCFWYRAHYLPNPTPLESKLLERGK